MLRRKAGDAGSHWALPVLACISWVGVLVGMLLLARSRDHLSSLSVLLGLGALVAGLLVAGTRNGLSVSAAFIVSVLAAALLGPASAAVAAVVSELAATARLKTRARMVLLVNLPASVLPAATAGLLISAAVAHPTDDAGFYLAVGLAASVDFALS